MKLTIRSAVVLTLILCALFLLLAEYTKIKEQYVPLNIGKPHYTLAEANAVRTIARSRASASIDPAFSKSSPAHVLIYPKQSGRGLKITMAQYPAPYPVQKGGSCMGHALGQLLRYTSWRYKCSSRAQCLSWDPPRPCPYFLANVGQCGPYTSIKDGNIKQYCLKDGEGVVWSTPYETLAGIQKVGYVYKGDWKVNGRDIAEKERPFRHFPNKDVFAKASKNRPNYRIVVLNSIDKDQYRNGAEFYNVLLSGHAIFCAIDIGPTLVCERQTIAGWNVDVIKHDDNYTALHAIMLIGAIYDGNTLYFQIQNSWGKGYDHVYISIDELRKRRGFGITLVWT